MKFTINLQKKTCRLNGKLVDLSRLELPDVEMPVMAWIEILYKYYKRSIPSERSESHRRCYFKAKAESEISDEDMMYGEPREPMRCRLELFVLLSIYHGKLTWHDEWGSWFWQSPSDKDLIILREWVEPNKGGK